MREKRTPTVMCRNFLVEFMVTKEVIHKCIRPLLNHPDECKCFCGRVFR